MKELLASMCDCLTCWLYVRQLPPFDSFWIKSISSNVFSTAMYSLMRIRQCWYFWWISVILLIFYHCPIHMNRRACLGFPVYCLRSYFVSRGSHKCGHFPSSQCPQKESILYFPLARRTLMSSVGKMPHVCSFTEARWTTSSSNYYRRWYKPRSFHLSYNIVIISQGSVIFHILKGCTFQVWLWSKRHPVDDRANIHKLC